jgi:hypothetical protein
VPLKEGTFTGGNIFIARAEKIEECLPKVEEFIRLRKSFSKMVLRSWEYLFFLNTSPASWLLRI